LDLADFKVETGALSGLFYILLSQGGDWCFLRSILYLIISRWRLVQSQVYFISFYLKVETGALSGLFYIFLSLGGDWYTLRSILNLFISRWRLVLSQVYFISCYKKNLMNFSHFYNHWCSGRNLFF